jgi:hypothetical protein
MSRYQQRIVNALKVGARLQCTEGRNYRAWLVYTDGTIEKIRRDSANRVCMDYDKNLIFGEWGGIRWRK